MSAADMPPRRGLQTRRALQRMQCLAPKGRMPWSADMSHRSTPPRPTANPTTRRMPSRTSSPRIQTGKICTSPTPTRLSMTRPFTQPFKSTNNPSFSHSFFLLGFLDSSSRMQNARYCRASDFRFGFWKTNLESGEEVGVGENQILLFECSIRHVG